MRHKTHIKHKGGTYEYRRAYYHLYQKPFRGSKDGWAEGRYKCVLCGFQRRLNVFSGLKVPKMKVISAGTHNTFIWSDINSDVQDTRMKSLFNSYIQTLVARCREFLAMYDPEYRKLALAQEISREVGSNQKLFPTTLFIPSMTANAGMMSIEGIKISRR